jgi:hypothetical protein
MRRTVFALCTLLYGCPGSAQDDDRTLRDLLIYGPDGGPENATWLHQPGGGLDLAGAIALPCLLANLSFNPSGEIVFPDPSKVVTDCPDAIISGDRALHWEVVVIERLGVERLRISSSDDQYSCDFAVPETTPALTLATICDGQDFPRYFRFVADEAIGNE